jgi:ribose-phosphate pyrophosphokinase
MMEKGALSVRAICTHAIRRRLRKIERSQLLELIVTDSIPLKKESKKNKSVELCPLLLQMLCTWYIIIIPLKFIIKKQFLYLGS